MSRDETAPVDAGAREGPIEGRCAGRSSRTGKPCKKFPVKGATVCATHGGKAPQVKAAAKRRREEAAAHAAVATYGLPREISPGDALLEEIHRTAGHVSWLGRIVAGLQQDELVWGLAEEVDAPIGEDGSGGVITKHRAGVNTWVKLYQDERKHLAAVARDAKVAGIAEQQVEIEKQRGVLLGTVIQRILERLSLTPEQVLLMQAVVPEELRKIEAIEGGR